MPTKTELHQRQTQLATHYLEKLCEATTHYKNRDLETGLALFDTHWPQIHWNVTRLIERAPADETAAALVVDYLREGAAILRLRQPFPEQIAWLNAALQGHPQEIELLILLGHVYNGIDDYVAATACFEAVLAQTTDPYQRIEAQYGLGGAARRRGDYAMALNLFQSVLPQFEAVDNIERVLSLLGELSFITTQQGDYIASRHHRERALALAEQHGDQRIIGLRLSSLGETLRDMGDFPTAQMYVERAAAIQRQLGDQHGLLSSLDRLGSIAFMLGDYPLANDYWTRALSISDRFGIRKTNADLLRKLGIAAQRLNDHDTAFTYYQQALALYEAIDRRDAMALLLNSMGNFYFMQGDFPAARDCFEQGLRTAQTMTDLSIVPMIAVGLTEVNLKLGEVESARTALAEGLRIASTDPVRIALLSSAARFWFQRGNALQAAEWLGLILAHPASEAQNREEIEAWLPEFKAVLSAEALQAALERGAALELATVLEEILAAL